MLFSPIFSKDSFDNSSQIFMKPLVSHNKNYLLDLILQIVSPFVAAIRKPESCIIN